MVRKIGSNQNGLQISPVFGIDIDRYQISQLLQQLINVFCSCKNIKTTVVYFVK